MIDHDTTPVAAIDAAEHDDSRDSGGRHLPLLVFGVTSLGFFAWLAIGSVEARIWRFNRLYFEDRTIREVWGYFSDRLPEMPGQPVITGLFWISLVVMVVGTVLGLWLFLVSPDEDPSGTPTRNVGVAASHD